MHPVEATGDLRCLVALDGADEVPLQIEVGAAVQFRARFLQVVFPEGTLAQSGELPNVFDRLALARRQQHDTARRATKTLLCDAQTFLNIPPAGAQRR